MKQKKVVKFPLSPLKELLWELCVRTHRELVANAPPEMVYPNQLPLAMYRTLKRRLPDDNNKGENLATW